ncbi:MAG: sensor histidine kinase [Bacteroidetes bacterium]|nr:sensor histidine kinase [Bacteroidota bacterium]
MIEITVKDTGIGIEASNLQKIFTRFFRSNMVQTKQALVLDSP